MMRFAYSIVFVLALLTWPACAPETSGSIGKIGNGLAELSGRVQSETGQPLANVRIVAGRYTTTSDADGYWRIRYNSQMASPTTITYFRRGFAPLTRVLSGKNLHLDARLQAALVTRQLDVAEGGSLSYDRDNNGQSDIRLTFTPNFIDGLEQVEVSLSEIRPSDSAALARFPGQFVSIDGQNKVQQNLQSFGAFNVSFHQGDTLLSQVNLAAPAEFEITLAPQTVLTNGETVVLSWLDSQNGQWVREGEGIVVVQNGIVVVRGQVEHFTWWNLERSLEHTGCLEASLVAAQPQDMAFLSRFELLLAGTDYFGQTPSVALGNTGVTTVVAPNNHSVQPSFRYRGAGPEGFQIQGQPVTLNNSACKKIETKLAVRPGNIFGFVQNSAKQPVTDAIVAIVELGAQTKPNAQGYFEFTDVPWSTVGVNLTLRALAPHLRIVPVNVSNQAAQTRVDLLATNTPRAPWFISQALSDSQPTTTSTVDFSFTVQDDLPGLTWSAVPTTGTVSNVTASELDDGSLYQLTISGKWQAVVTGPAELRLIVRDASEQRSEWTLKANWQ